MKISITIRQTSSAMPVRNITSRLRQNEIFEDYSQVRVYSTIFKVLFPPLNRN